MRLDLNAIVMQYECLLETLTHHFLGFSLWQFLITHNACDSIHAHYRISSPLTLLVPLFPNRAPPLVCRTGAGGYSYYSYYVFMISNAMSYPEDNIS